MYQKYSLYSASGCVECVQFDCFLKLRLKYCNNDCKVIKMWNRVVFCCLFFVLVCAEIGDDQDKCVGINCYGEEYECIDGTCYCAKGYIPNHFQNRCIRCPGLGEKCLGPCCNVYGNGSLQCWQGICQPCYDNLGKWTCRESLEQILISSTQVIMGAALILGIIATFILLYKLCATTDIRAFGSGSNSDGRLSIGSLQLYVDERLRDAPPRYSRTPAAGSATFPAVAFVNAGFIHDSSIPPPPYTAEDKTEENQNTINQNIINNNTIHQSTINHNIVNHI